MGSQDGADFLVHGLKNVVASFGFRVADPQDGARLEQGDTVEYSFPGERDSRKLRLGASQIGRFWLIFGQATIDERSCDSRVIHKLKVKQPPLTTLEREKWLTRLSALFKYHILKEELAIDYNQGCVANLDTMSESVARIILEFLDSSSARQVYQVCRVMRGWKTFSLSLSVEEASLASVDDFAVRSPLLV